MSDRSVSPGTVNPNVNFPPLVREIPDFPAPTYIHGSDADHDDEYLNNIRTVGAASGYPDDMSNLFPPTDNRRVPFTVSSALRHTDYKEEWEPKERRSDEYIAAQIQILNYLSTHAADELTAAQAHFFTENAGTKPYGPSSAKQVVQMCYFMRSHGFDTYAKMVPQSQKIRLYVANRDAVNRSRDRMYWEQDLKTGEVVPMSDMTREARRGGGRRGAMAHIFGSEFLRD